MSRGDSVAKYARKAMLQLPEEQLNPPLLQGNKKASPMDYSKLKAIVGSMLSQSGEKIPTPPVRFAKTIHSAVISARRNCGGKITHEGLRKLLGESEPSANGKLKYLSGDGNLWSRIQHAEEFVRSSGGFEAAIELLNGLKQLAT